LFAEGEFLRCRIKGCQMPDVVFGTIESKLVAQIKSISWGRKWSSSTLPLSALPEDVKNVKSQISKGLIQESF
jgi:hypothetical protein